MDKQLTFAQAAAYGFTFPGAREWYSKERLAQLAQDAALITMPNTSVPVELLAYIDPAVITILTAPLMAREIFTEEKWGDWTTPYAKWRVDEPVGRTQAYSDFSDAGVSDVNSVWPTRAQYVFQTIIKYGDREVATASMAKLELAAAKQRSAATILDIDANMFYLLGVAGMEIYGVLNDPNTPPAITPASVGGSTAWAGKSTQQRYDDILALFGQLVSQSRGRVLRNSPLKLLLSPEMEVMLGAATDFNVSVLDMISRYFTDLKIISVPQLSSPLAGQTMMMIAGEVAAMKTGTLGYGEKIRALRIVPELSSLKQKWVCSTYGGIVKMPFAVAQMIGI